MKTKINNYLVIGIIFLLILSIGVFIYEEKSKSKIINEKSIYENENLLYKTILKAGFEMSKISIDGQKAEDYYNEAGYSYENQNYNLVESNCRLARGYYSSESQGYRNIKADLLSSGIKDNLIDIYINSLDSIIEITNNMYEACEHFESASRYYNKYYNTNVPYDDSSYDMGTAEIDNMNEKIKAHDNAVEKYNQYLEDFRVELDKRLK